ncbi:MAG TPA: PKD domain-containing protein, partial [Flavobacteriales bacterium]|nr:PKD domain-containing protein [Flavobacteriales bacterium]
IFDTDQGVGTGVSTSAFADTLDLLAEGVASGLALGTHLFGVRAKDEQGLWSHTKWLSINICETYAPVAAFTPIISGTSVSFQNNSLRGTSYAWDFGDGATSTLQYPVHAYGPGTYDARLITVNPCYQDTAYASLYLPGLNQFSPHSGGNTGLVTLSLHGFGFDENTIVSLVRAGYSDIAPLDDIVTVLSISSAQVTFDLNGADPGPWTLEVLFGNGVTVQDQQAFEIVTGDADYELSVALIGSPVLRGAGVYTLRITNNSNIDARFIPIEISLDDTAGSIGSLQPLITWGIDDELVQGGMWSFTATYDGGLTHWRTYPMFAYLVPANGTLDIPIRVVLPLGNSQIEVRIGEPIDFNTGLFASLVEDLAIITDQSNGIVEQGYAAAMRSDCFARGGKAALLTAATTAIATA